MSTVPFSQRRSTPPLEKPLPHNLEAERSILAAILLDGSTPNKTLADTAQKIKPDDFFLEQHRTILRSMLSLSGNNSPVDLITLIDRLQVNGDIQSAGGVAYVSSLVDGVPRVSNTGHHIQLVKSKARLRTIIHTTHAITQRAIEGIATPEDLSDELEKLGKLDPEDNHKLVAVDCRELLMMDLRPVEYMIQPILPVKGIGMLYAWRGVGKTFVTMEIAYCIAAGVKKCFVWDIPERRRVVYVDGEMDVETLQERLKSIVKGHEASQVPEEDFLRFITPDLQREFQPKINSYDGQAAIEAHLRAGDLLILDNLSALSPCSAEDETGDWVMVQEWLLKLRRGGITVLFMHHAGKSGSQRGFSGREDLINVTINLRRSEGYQVEEQLRTEVHLEKIRGKSAVGEWVQPFEIQLTTENDRAVWLHRPLKHIIEKRAFEMLAAGMKPNDVAQDLRLSRYQVYRLNKKFQSGIGPETGEPN